MRKIAIFIFSAMHKNAECIIMLVMTPKFLLLKYVLTRKSFPLKCSLSAKCFSTKCSLSAKCFHQFFPHFPCKINFLESFPPNFLYNPYFFCTFARRTRAVDI